MYEIFDALIATEDATLAAQADSVLQRLRFKVAMAGNDAEMFARIRAQSPDILLLDIELPRRGGVEACCGIRENPATSDMPVIMLTKCDDGRETIQALEAGADDCVSKPPQPDILAAHIKALARRTLPGAEMNHLLAGPIDMDLARWTVSVGNTAVDLTKTEFRLLQTLLEATGRALTRDYLLQKVWPHSAGHGPDTRTVDVHIGRLRRKLGATGKFIITVRNVGFRFEIQTDWIATAR